MNIYSFPTFNLTKILLTAQELKEDYQLTLLDITKGEHKTEEHLARHPLGKVPAVEIDGNNYFESNAICRLLCERNNNEFYGDAVEQRALVNQWVDMATLHVGRWLTVVFFERIVKPALFDGESNQVAIEEAENYLSQQLPVIEKQLEMNSWLAGSKYSIADIIAFSYLTTIELSGISLDKYPKLKQWFFSIKNRSSYTKAMSHFPNNDMFSLLK